MKLCPPAWWISLPAILSSPKTGTSLLALPTAATLGALGIVYGDIGTSPALRLQGSDQGGQRRWLAHA